MLHPVLLEAEGDGGNPIAVCMQISSPGEYECSHRSSSEIREPRQTTSLIGSSDAHLHTYTTMREEGTRVEYEYSHRAATQRIETPSIEKNHVDTVIPGNCAQ